MRPTQALTTGLLAAAVLAGCAHATAPTATLVTATAPAPAAAAAPAQVAPTVQLEKTAAPAASVTSFGAGQEISGSDVPADVATAMKAEAATTPEEGATTRRETGDAHAANILDPWRPYALGVANVGPNAITLTWRTDLNSRAIVYYAKSFGFSWHGFTQVYPENNSTTFHMVTIPGLSRFRKYRFLVVGLAPLGMQFPSYPIDFRTHLF